MRCGCASKITHLARILPRRQIAYLISEVDEAIKKGYEQINKLPKLEGWRQTALRMPMRNGGLGIRAIDDIVDGAYVGAVLQVAKHVRKKREQDTIGGRKLPRSWKRK